jgi:hypothetical protein
MTTKTWWVLGLCLVACSSSETPTDDGGTDASADATTDAPNDASPTDAGKDSAPTCSGFVTDAAAIMQMFVATDTPVGDGGTLVDGIYDITSWSVYTGVDGGTGPTGRMSSATQNIEAGAWGYDEHWTLGDAGGVQDVSGTFTTLDGGGLVGVGKCGGSSPFTSYSTDGTNVTFFSANPPWGLTEKRR